MSGGPDDVAASTRTQRAGNLARDSGLVQGLGGAALALHLLVDACGFCLLGMAGLGGVGAAAQDEFALFAGVCFNEGDLGGFYLGALEFGSVAACDGTEGTTQGRSALGSRRTLAGVGGGIQGGGVFAFDAQTFCSLELRAHAYQLLVCDDADVLGVDGAHLCGGDTGLGLGAGGGGVATIDQAPVGEVAQEAAICYKIRSC